MRTHTLSKYTHAHSYAHVHVDIHAHTHMCAHTPTCVYPHTHKCARTHPALHTGVPGSLSSLVRLGPATGNHTTSVHSTTVRAPRPHALVPSTRPSLHLAPSTQATCFPSHLPVSSRSPSGMAWNSLLAGARTGPSCPPRSLLGASWTFTLHTSQKELQLLLALSMTCSSHSLSAWQTPAVQLRPSPPLAVFTERSSRGKPTSSQGPKVVAVDTLATGQSATCCQAGAWKEAQGHSSGRAEVSAGQQPCHHTLA